MAVASGWLLRKGRIAAYRHGLADVLRRLAVEILAEYGGEIVIDRAGCYQLSGLDHRPRVDPGMIGARACWRLFCVKDVHVGDRARRLPSRSWAITPISDRPTTSIGASSTQPPSTRSRAASRRLSRPIQPFAGADQSAQQGLQHLGFVLGEAVVDAPSTFSARLVQNSWLVISIWPTPRRTASWFQGSPTQ